MEAPILVRLDKRTRLFDICSMSGLHLIWFRNDLRVHDHAALRAACHCAERDGGAVLALYTLTSDTSDQTGQIASGLLEALRELQVALDRRGAQLHLRYGQPLEILSELHRQHRILSLHCHETPETTHLDQQLKAWAMRAGVALRVYQQYGPLPVVNGFFEADSDWEHFMSEPRREASDVTHAADVGVGRWPESQPEREDSLASAGGRKRAIQLLRDFLGSPSDPGTGPVSGFASGKDAYQALRPYLQLGVLSVRETWQAAISARQRYLAAGYELRAARVGNFVACLPALHLEKHRVDRSGVRRADMPSASRDTDDQMSFEFPESRRG
jgi:deoxyribodipyrimidine photo-lyase